MQLFTTKHRYEYQIQISAVYNLLFERQRQKNQVFHEKNQMVLS